MTRTDVVEPDRATITAFWERFVAAHRDSAASEPSAVECFGDSQEVAAELLDLVLDGPKRATASCAIEYELEALPLPAVGEQWVAHDGAGRPRAVLETTDVHVGPLSSVDDRFAWDEGEGDRSRTYWLEAHTDFFQRYLPTIGVEFDPDLPVVFERFTLLYAEDERGRPLTPA